MTALLNLQDAERESQLPPLLRQAFRPFFLFGATFATLAMALWLAALTGLVRPAPLGGMLFWHQHEMLFGFVAAIIMGFLLTAVQNWTGIRAVHGMRLFALVSLWLLARLLIWFNPHGLGVWVSLADLLFLPLGGLFLAFDLIRANNRRNLFFLPLLLVLCAANGMTHLGLHQGKPEWIMLGNRGAIFVIVALMTVIAGRVLPMFTANGTSTPRATPTPWLDRLCIGMTGLIAALFLSGWGDRLPWPFMALVLALAALAHISRMVHWYHGAIWRVPLVWSLHLAYGFIPLGFVLLALHYAQADVSVSTGLHAMTAGAMGSLILAMMARISLGHSGRSLAIGPAVVCAFGMLALAGIIRVVSAYTPGSIALVVAGGLWILAYLIYVLQYIGILITPRADGRPG